MASETERKKREAEFDNNFVRNISEIVYRDRLGEDDTRRMLLKDGDSGEKLRERSVSYDSLTRSYLRAFKSARRNQAEAI